MYFKIKYKQKKRIEKVCNFLYVVHLLYHFGRPRELCDK